MTLPQGTFDMYRQEHNERHTRSETQVNASLTRIETKLDKLYREGVSPPGLPRRDKVISIGGGLMGAVALLAYAVAEILAMVQ